MSDIGRWHERTVGEGKGELGKGELGSFILLARGHENWGQLVFGSRKIEGGDKRKIETNEKDRRVWSTMNESIPFCQGPKFPKTNSGKEEGMAGGKKTTAMGESKELTCLKKTGHAPHVPYSNCRTVKRESVNIREAGEPNTTLSRN